METQAWVELDGDAGTAVWAEFADRYRFRAGPHPPRPRRERGDPSPDGDPADGIRGHPWERGVRIDGAGAGDPRGEPPRCPQWWRRAARTARGASSYRDPLAQRRSGRRLGDARRWWRHR